MWKPGLRGKFLGGLLIATALPLVVGLVLLETWGYRHLMGERGRLHQMEAMTLVKAIDQASEAEGEQFRTWIAADPAVLEFVRTKNRELAAGNRSETELATKRLDADWESLVPEDPGVKAVTSNPAAESLARYRNLHPEIAEILVTDVDGRLAAATGKASDYDQADETWWQKGKQLREKAAWRDGLKYDASSKAFSLDVVVPIYDTGVHAGVAKISVDVSSLFARLGFDGEELGERWEIVLPDGRVLASSRMGFVPLRDQMAGDTLQAMRQGGREGMMLKDGDGDSRMTGYVAVGDPGETPRAYVMFSSRRNDVVAPLQRRLIWLGVISGLAVIGCGLGGYAFVNRKVLKPLNVLGKAARSVAETATYTPGGERDETEATLRRG